MSRSQVIEVHCDRCSRTEYLSTNRAKDDPERDLLDKTHFKSSFMGEDIVFADLCTKCRKAVGNYLQSILKAKKEEEEDAETPPSIDPTTNVTPPGADPAAGASQVQPATSAS